MIPPKYTAELPGKAVNLLPIKPPVQLSDTDMDNSFSFNKLNTTSSIGMSPSP